MHFNRPRAVGPGQYSARLNDPPRVVILGAGHGFGRACATALAGRGARLILGDNDARALNDIAGKLQAFGRYCDVASEASVAVFAAEVLAEFPELDMVINAAGAGYERTLGMYRMSRTLMPGLRRGRHGHWLLNVPPVEDPLSAIFPYASSQQGFARLSARIASEVRGSSVRVLVADPSQRRISPVLTDQDTQTASDSFPAQMDREAGEGELAAKVAALLYSRWSVGSS